MRPLRFLFALLPLAFFAGCSDENNPENPGSGTMVVRMTDAPAAVQAVNLVVTGVAVRMQPANSSDSLSGWQVLNASTHTYNLMTLQNGTFTTIASGTLPAGTYTQIRLMLGAGSTIVVDGSTLPLTVPSGLQSGFKVNGSFLVTSGRTSDVSLEFDASRSIVQTGAQAYLLKPVVRAMTTSAAGAIRGVVVPPSVATSVFATQGSDTVGTAQTNTSGQFQMNVLNPGVYTVRVHPSVGFGDQTFPGVLVTAGNTAAIDTVQLRATGFPQ